MADVMAALASPAEGEGQTSGCPGAGEEPPEEQSELEARQERTGKDVPGPAKILCQTLSEDPPMYLYEDFCSPGEVEHLIQLCEGRWRPSMTSRGLESQLHGSSVSRTNEYDSKVVSKTRTSESVELDWKETHVSERIAARVATVCGVPLNRVEPLVILRYEPGQYFKQHHDGSMRSHTVFMYLNDVEDGAEGETLFPKLGFQVRPKAHTALMWRNIDVETGSGDMRLVHEAKPLLAGVKYGINCFVNVEAVRDASHVTMLVAEK